MTSAMQEAHRQALLHAVHDAYVEVFPAATIEQRLSVLPAHSYVAVTCSPTRGVDVTLDLCERLIARGFRVVPHVSAKMVRDDRHLRDILHRVERLHIDALFVPGGDGAASLGKFSTAFDLLRAIADCDHKVLHLGIAAHPEGHPVVAHDVLMRELERKQQFATYLVTQMCFDAGALTRWIHEIRQRGIGLPAWLGVPGVVDRAALLMTSVRIGVGDSLRFLRSHGKIVGHMLRSSAYRPDTLVRDLAPALADPAMRIAGFHIYCFNQVEKSEIWRREFLAELRQPA